MNDKTELKPLPPELPKTLGNLLALRKGKVSRTLNDQVEEVYHTLAEDEKFQALLYAVYDEQAVEGSLSADNIMAAEMIRKKARDTNKLEVGRQKLASISKALGVVLKRYTLSRKDRRNMIGGEILKTEDQNND